jgi:hypothetical protein
VQRVAEVLEQLGGELRARGAVGSREPVAQVGDSARVLPARHGGDPGAQQELRPRDPGALLGFGHPIPQHQRAIELPQGLRVGEDPLRRPPGPHRGGERLRLVLRVGEVRRLLRRDRELGHVVAEQLGAPPDRLADRVVELGALARKQIAVDRLGHERVPERVAAAAVQDEDLMGDGVAGSDQQIGRRQRRHRANQVVRHGAVGDRGDAHDVLRRRRQPLHAHEQRIGERGGKLVAAAVRGGQELFRVQRIAVGAVKQPRDERRIGRGFEDAGELLGRLVPG